MQLSSTHQSAAVGHPWTRLRVARLAIGPVIDPLQVAVFVFFCLAPRLTDDGRELKPT